MRFSEMPIRWARQVAHDRRLAVEFRQDAFSSNSARSYYTFSIRARFHFGMSEKNRTNKKRKLNRRRQRGLGCGFSQVIRLTPFGACHADLQGQVDARLPRQTTPPKKFSLRLFDLWSFHAREQTLNFG